MYAGRPDTCHGPPITLYDPVFAELNDQLRNLSTVSPTKEALELTRDLFSDASGIYPHEDTRIGLMVPYLKALLGLPGLLTHMEQTEGRAIGDCMETVKLPGGVAGLGPVFVYMEWTPELGVGGDPGLQVAHTYRMHVIQDEYQQIRDNSCCPCILMAFAGSYFSVFGAVLIDVPFVQPFTEYHLLGGDPHTDESVVHVARIFHVLSRALAALRQGYLDLKLDGGYRIEKRLFPKPVLRNPLSTLPNIVYIDRFYCRGWRLEDHRQPIYLARLLSDERSGTVVVVKFSKTYNADAHKLLVEQGLAPTLHFAEPVRGGHTMIVMDFVDDLPSSEPLSEAAKSDVKKAIAILHESGFVFGDLRRSNVL
ncbi:hypothetical protein OF83DRAFT_1064772, partial [Amylostereum chailletii]